MCCQQAVGRAACGELRTHVRLQQCAGWGMCASKCVLGAERAWPVQPHQALHQLVCVGVLPGVVYAVTTQATHTSPAGQQQATTVSTSTIAAQPSPAEPWVQ